LLLHLCSWRQFHEQDEIYRQQKLLKFVGMNYDCETSIYMASIQKAKARAERMKKKSKTHKKLKESDYI
jgi:hypothetical protein